MLVQRTILERDCPVCLENVFPKGEKEAKSIGEQWLLDCGHAIHKSCWYSAPHDSISKKKCSICREDLKSSSFPWEGITNKVCRVYKKELEMAPENIHKTVGLLTVGIGYMFLYSMQPHNLLLCHSLGMRCNDKDFFSSIFLDTVTFFSVTAGSVFIGDKLGELVRRVSVLKHPSAVCSTLYRLLRCR